MLRTDRFLGLTKHLNVTCDSTDGKRPVVGLRRDPRFNDDPQPVYDLLPYLGDDIFRFVRVPRQNEATLVQLAVALELPVTFPENQEAYNQSLEEERHALDRR